MRSQDCTDTEKDEQYPVHGNIVEESTACNMKLFSRGDFEIKCLSLAVERSYRCPAFYCMAADLSLQLN